MLQRTIKISALLTLFIILTCTVYGQANSAVVKYVSPFIGTENGGNVFVGAAVPFGMVKLGPDCGNNDSNSGYLKDGNINGFSHTHVSGTGGGAKYGNILLMPVTGEISLQNIGSPRSEEVAEAGYYSVLLSRYNIKAALTATAGTGFHRYTFPENQESSILVDAGHFLLFGKDWGEAQELVGSETRILSDHEIEGYNRVRGGWNKGDAYTVYFYAIFDQPAIQSGTWLKDQLQPGVMVQSDRSEKTGAYFTFAKSNTAKTIQVKVGISFISTAKAKFNAENEIPDWDFDAVRTQTSKLWNNRLSKIQLVGSETYKTMFYTALYHSMLMPSNRTGENPKWKSGEPYYDDYYAIWDTYRTTHPLLTLIAPEVQRDMIRSMIDIYRFDGYMPDARSGNDNGRTQGGSNCDIVIADAFLKGLKGIDYETALKAMIKNAEVSPGGNEQKEGRGGIADYNSLGYVSTRYERAGTRTVEYSACDFAIATLAKGLGKNDIYEKYSKRSSNWKNLWRPVESYGAKGFIWPRKPDGSWDENFSTLQAGSWSDFFYESQSWELSLYVPHDNAGLIEMCGGPKAFESRLDTFFAKSKLNKNGWLMDFYNVNNEPGFLTPMLYNYIGKPDKSNERIRQIINTYFNAGTKGLPGNDDSGAMSSWLAFQLMGFYPVAGQDLYLIGAPHFEKTTLSLENGKSFTVTAKNLSAKNKYIQSATLNGKALGHSWFSHTDIMQGGTLEFIMGEKPAKSEKENTIKSAEKTQNLVFKPGEKWTDTDGIGIEAHGGGMLKVGEIYYWYGENHALGEGNKTGISCYSSKDLFNWKNEGVVLPKEKLPEMFRDSGVCERPKVIYNSKTKKYVMWMHLDARQYTVSMAGVAVSDSPVGKFDFIGYQRPITFGYAYAKEPRVPGFDSREKDLGNTFRDMALFLDDDGKAYVIYSAEENASLYCVRLNDEFTDIQKPVVKGESWERIIPDVFYEAPAPFKYNGKYYLLASGTSGWDPNPAKLAVADNIFGPWKLFGNPCLGPGSETTFRSQSTFVIPAPGRKGGSFIYMGDRWNGSELQKSTYVWLPFRINDAGNFKLVFFDKWDFSIFDSLPEFLQAPIISLKSSDTLCWKLVSGANAYKIFKNAQHVSMTSGTTYHIPEEFAGTRYNYSVVAWNLSGKNSISSNLVTISQENATPVYLSDMQPYSSVQGWGTLQCDKSIKLPQINIAGKEFTKGLGTHANSSIIYFIGGKYRSFTSRIGVDYFTNFTKLSSVQFEVWGDGELLFQSEVMKVNDEARLINIDITGIHELKLMVNDAGDGTNWDHADWAEAKLIP